MRRILLAAALACALSACGAANIISAVGSAILAVAGDGNHPSEEEQQ